MKLTQFKWLAAMILLVTAMVMPSSTWAQSTIPPSKPSTGDGSENSPYEIGTAAELYWFAALVNGKLEGETQNASANAELTADITVNTGVLKSDGTLADNVSGFDTWTPIYSYEGTFDGQGHTISGLYFNYGASYSYIGLFGSNSGTIKNVGVVDSYFCGKSLVGGVCGNNSGGTITGCYNTGTISGNQYVGGVCGFTNSSGTITGCYNTGAVSCNDNSVGGVCGQKSSGTITNCYYLSGTATGGIGSNDVAGSAEAKTAAQFKSGEVCYLLNGSRSEGTEENPLAWYQNIDNGTADSYPLLDSNGHGKVYQCTPCTGVYSNTENKAGEHLFGENDNGFCHNCGAYQPATLTTDKYDIDGNDTKDEVYEIGNAGQLYWFANKVNTENATYGIANAVLTADITVNTGVLKENGTLADNVSGFDTWTPIYSYKGKFDGQGHTISGLYFNISDADIVGFTTVH